MTDLCAKRRASKPDGFTLIEVMVVVLVIGVLTAFAVPSYRRAMEQSRADMAAANLRGIWAAQRIYWIDYHTYTNNLTLLNTLGLLGPEILTTNTGFAFSVTAGSDAFEASATRKAGALWPGSLTSDETGELSGALTSTAQPEITAGFQ